ncbi:MAG: hypothetical protein HQK54_05605 [Oligoflexales bacterium]|nr:hypothetical protein [Oligoflexales bacterium]
MIGATQKPTQLNITDDHSLFVKKTGMLCRPHQLIELGFRMDNISCMFWESEAEALLQFCKENPEYHIISATNGRFENRYVPSRNVYMLAKSDKDPNFILDMCLKKSPSLVAKEGLEEALAIISNIDRGHKPK